MQRKSILFTHNTVPVKEADTISHEETNTSAGIRPSATEKANNPTNNKANKQTNKQTDTQAYNQTYKQTNEEASVMFVKA